MKVKTSKTKTCPRCKGIGYLLKYKQVGDRVDITGTERCKECGATGYVKIKDNE